MPAEDISDDYVAEALKKDARDSSIRYSALGLQAFLPKRPTTSAPKPNTRFLRHLLKDTDNHNKALLAKEAEEARARQRTLEREDRKNRERYRDSTRDHDKREERDRYRHHKRRRLDESEDETERDRERSHRRSRSHSHRHRRRHDDSDEERYSDRRRRQRHREESPTADDSDREIEREDDGKLRRRRYRSRSRDYNDRRRDRRKEGHGDSPHCSRRRARQASSGSRPEHPAELPEKVPGRVTRDNEEGKPSSKESPASDSDPLEAIIGPPPPPPEPKVKSRGRGAFKSSSAMDSHFSTSYDPTVDVVPNSDSEEDWEQAVEAFRDRQKWKQQGADRLREAGFSEKDIQKWEKGGERAEEDVQWAKKGEGREWDRGKVVDSDGIIDTKPEWGRLKGT